MYSFFYYIAKQYFYICCDDGLVLEDTDYGDYEEPRKNCSVTETIKGGSVLYSNGGLEGSVLMYQCEVGHYPYPVRTRMCSSKGEWSVMMLPNGRSVLTATCKGEHEMYYLCTKKCILFQFILVVLILRRLYSD